MNKGVRDEVRGKKNKKLCVGVLLVLCRHDLERRIVLVRARERRRLSEARLGFRSRLLRRLERRRERQRFTPEFRERAKQVSEPNSCGTRILRRQTHLV